MVSLQIHPERSAGSLSNDSTDANVTWYQPAGIPRRFLCRSRQHAPSKCLSFGLGEFVVLFYLTKLVWFQYTFIGATLVLIATNKSTVAIHHILCEQQRL